jgi:uncharacterized protein YkwD
MTGHQQGGSRVAPSVPRRTGTLRRVLGALLVAAILSATVLPTAASAGRTAQDFVVPSIEYDAFVLLNQQRAANGVAPLRLNRQLTQAAEAYATKMATENNLSHIGTDGSTTLSRVDQSGYPLSLWVGEVISSNDRTAADAISGFMNSPGHHAVMLDVRFTDVGLGYSPEKTLHGGTRWVIDFASSVSTITPEPYTTPGSVASGTPTPQPIGTPVPLPTASAHRVYLPNVQR